VPEPCTEGDPEIENARWAGRESCPVQESRPQRSRRGIYSKHIASKPSCFQQMPRPRIWPDFAARIDESGRATGMRYSGRAGIMGPGH
jgi:hypothetical protein